METQPNTVIHVPADGDSQQEQIERRFPKKKIESTARRHLVWAAILALMMIIFHLLDSINTQAYTKLGIVNIVFCAFSGGFGLMAASRPSTGKLIAYMVLSIVTSVFVLPVMFLDGLYLLCSSFERQTISLITALTWVNFFICLVEEITAICTAVTCGQAACCAGCASTSEGAVFLYNPSIGKSTNANEISLL